MERYLKEPNVKEEKGMEGLDDLAHHLDFDASWIKHELLEEDFEPDNFKHELIIKSEPGISPEPLLRGKKLIASLFLAKAGPRKDI